MTVNQEEYTVRILARVSALTTLLAVSAAAHAGDSRPTPPSFADIDTNNDALISSDEFAAFAAARAEERGVQAPPGRRSFNPVERADADGDGYLNEVEFDALMQRMRDRMMDRGQRFRPPQEDTEVS